MNRFYILLLAFGIILGQGLAGAHLTHNSLSAQTKKSKRDKTGGKKGKKGNKKKGEIAADTDPKIKKRIDYLFIEANTQYLQQNLTEAVKLFEQILDLDPEHHATIYNIAKLLNEQENFEKASKYAKDALELNPDNYWYYKELVISYEGMMALDKALGVQKNMSQRFPEDKDAMFDLAQLYIANKDFNSAAEVYTNLEKLIGANEEVIFRKHQLYVFLNQFDEAIEEIERLIELNPGEQRYYQAKYDLFMMNGDEEKAQQVLEHLLEFNPDDGFALLSLADYYKSKGELKKSDDFLFRAFRNPEVDLEAKAKILGGMYPFAETDDKVLKRMSVLSGILQTLHPEDALVNGILGDIFQVSGEVDSARYYYRKSLDRKPANEQVWQELLFIDSENGEFIDLKTDAEEALEYFPNQAIFLYFFGIGSSNTGDNDEAVYAFEKIKKIGVTNKDLLIRAYVSLGEIYHERKDYSKSDENFEAALELDGKNALALNNFAYYLSLRNEQLDRAEKMVLQAIDIEPNSSAYHDTYGWILYLKGDYESAEEWIGKAVEAGGGAEVFEHYGDVWMKLGNAEKAREYWQKAKEKGASKLVIEEKIKNSGIK